MAFNIIIRADGMRLLAAASIAAGYTAVGTLFDHPMRIIKLVNLTDATVIFSYDGVVDHEIVPPNGFTLYDFTTNQAQTAGAFIAKDTVMYVKRSGVPTTGSVYVCAYYGKGD